METDIPQSFKDAVSKIFIFIVVVGVCCLIASSAPNPDGAKATVESAGYTDVVMGGPSALGSLYCGSDNPYYFGVASATNAQGAKITNMYVCSGLMKGYTIRYH